MLLSQGAPLQTQRFVALLAFSNLQRVTEPMEARFPPEKQLRNPPIWVTSLGPYTGVVVSLCMTVISYLPS